MLKLQHWASSVFLLSVFVATPSRAQQPQGPIAAPVPPMIGSAKSVFIANGAEEGERCAQQTWYAGDSNRTYDEFYAGMKSWGRFNLVMVPAEADLVFEVGIVDHNCGPSASSHFRVVIVDPKTHTTLWSVAQYIEPGGLAKTREKNYELAMTALVSNVKAVVLSPTAP
jgi:hypothetical protein